MFGRDLLVLKDTGGEHCNRDARIPQETEPDPAGFSDG
jgi:hypothetical protein